MRNAHTEESVTSGIETERENTTMNNYTCCKLGLCSKRSNFIDRIHPDTEETRKQDYSELDTSAVLAHSRDTERNLIPKRCQFLVNPTAKFPQFSQFALEALYRYQTSMQTAADSERLAYELALAETEQN